jgi:signal transduction histidine kinase
MGRYGRAHAGGAVRIVIALLTLILASPAAMAEAKRVLVLYENNRLLPANVEGDRGFSDAIGSGREPVDVRAEFLDYPDFGGDDYVRTVATYLREKYRDKSPDVVVAGGTGALAFILSHRDDMFRGAPIVFMGIDKDFVDSHALPTDVYGVPVDFDAIGTVEQALRWHPAASRLVVVTGDAPDDRAWLARLQHDLPRFRGRVSSIDYLTGLSTPELRDRLSKLGKDSVVFTPGYFKDGAGRSFAPRQAAGTLAEASAAPIYGPYNTFLGTGVVGGKVPTFYAMGQTAGRIVNQILDGKPVVDLHLPAVMPTTLMVDWRQIKRWGIDEAAVPPGTVVEFKAPGFWDQYRTQAIIALAVVALQSALVTGLLIERKRRRSAQNAVDRHRFELAHASRLAVAGELTASIAHEINQPLGAIQSNVSAATIMLDKRAEPDQLRPILEDIGRDNIRATDIIRQLRKLMEKHEVDRRSLDLGNAMVDTLTLLRSEAQRRRVELRTRQRAHGIRIIGDKVQIQQILINLVLNAMDAVADQREGRRIVTVSAAARGDSAVIKVKDTGHGIDASHQARLFDSFFSTKPNGIGLGLSIVRTLAEAHRGKVWAENEPGGGAVFFVSFPLVLADAELEVA